MSSLSAFKDEHGKFISYAWPGGVPCYYLDSESNTLCPDCANKSDMSSEVIVGDIYYEGPPMLCDDCGEPIDSAYGEPDNE